jgi:hypothetical protein
MLNMDEHELIHCETILPLYFIPSDQIAKLSAKTTFYIFMGTFSICISVLFVNNFLGKYLLFDDFVNY